MKSIRIENASPHLYLAAKRSSLNHEKLPQPYKIDWTANSFQNADSRSNSNKNFFQNMKDELSNIKQDFEKLIKKENHYSSASKTAKEDNVYSTGSGLTSGMKGKSLSSYKKDTRKFFKEPLQETDKLQIVMNHQENNDKYRQKMYSFDNAQPQSDKKHNSNTVEMKEKDFNNHNPLTKLHGRLLEEREDQVELHERYRSLKENPKVEHQIDSQQLRKLKLQVDKLSSELSLERQRYEQLKNQAEASKSQQVIFKQKLAQLSEELKRKMELAEQQDRKIKQMAQQLTNKEHQCKDIDQIQVEMEKQRAFYNERINELVFHNNNFDKVNGDLGRQNEALRANLQNMHHYVEQLKNITENAENDYKRKLQFMKRDIDQYIKREAMYEKEIEGLSSELRVRNQQQRPESDASSHPLQEHLLLELQHLKEELDKQNNQVKLQQKINASLTEKYEQELKKLNIEGLTQSLENTINRLSQQNARLKSKVNTLQADLGSLQEQNRSYLKEITLYEEREKTNPRSKQITSCQWEQLTQEIESLKKENSRLTQQLEWRQLKEQVANQSQSLSWQSDQIVEMSRVQLQEIERMKEMMKDLKAQNEFLRRELERQGEICVNLRQENKQLSGQGRQQDKKHCCYIKEMGIFDRKKQQIDCLKRLIFKVIVEKIGKQEGEGDSAFCLRKLQQLRPLLDQQ